MRKNLEGWEDLLKELGYRYDPVKREWVNYELQSSFDQDMVERYFNNLDEMREMIMRLKTDPELLKTVLEWAHAIADAYDEFMEAKGTKSND